MCVMCMRCVCLSLCDVLMCVVFVGGEGYVCMCVWCVCVWCVRGVCVMCLCGVVCVWFGLLGVCVMCMLYVCT